VTVLAPTRALGYSEMIASSSGRALGAIMA